MPVGTLATVKGISSEQLARTGAQMVLSNTYHLHLQPGEEIVKAADMVTSARSKIQYSTHPKDKEFTVVTGITITYIL